MVYLRNSGIQIKGSESVVNIFRDLLSTEDALDQDKEHYYVCHLDVKARVNLVELVAIGILNSCVVHPRETYRRAVSEGSASIIIGHNHPSGEVDPSDEDTSATKAVFEAGQILGITMLDHVIFSAKSGKYFSYRDNQTHEINPKQKGGDKNI